MNLNDEISQYRQEIKTQRMDMSFGEIANMYRDNELIISPEYQRSFRWDEQRQTDFIESILLGIPFPSIFVATNEDGTWELIDGLQRVSTVLSFLGELKPVDGKENVKNRLKLLEGGLVKGLKGLTFQTLPREYRLQIKRTPCRVEIILKESNFNMRYELFKRLNTGGEGLSRQEIRNCIFRGLDSQYTNLIKELAGNDNFKSIIKINDQKQESMYYDELVLRFLALKNCISDYSESNIQDFMDKYLKRQCESFDAAQANEDKTLFLDIINRLKLIGDDTIFSLGTQHFSTSMYDAIMLGLSANRDSLKFSNEELLSKFVSLKNNLEFKKYIGSASSNPGSIKSKFKIAKQVLA